MEGDLVFRKGRGLAGNFILMVNNEIDFTHVGIITKIDDNLKIVHCVPYEDKNTKNDETIKCENIEQFFAKDKATKGSIRRFNFDTVIINKAVQKAKILFHKKIKFDHKFNISDTTKMYCTEFVWQCYLFAGVDITEGRRTVFPAIENEFIFPINIFNNNNLKTIYEF